MPTFLQKHAKIILLFTPIFWLLPNVVFAADTLESVIYFFVINFFGLFLGLAAALLDAGINDFVIKFGDLYTTGGVGVAIDAAWYSVRDIFNITFIFGLVYIGFKMILDSSSSDTKRWLIKLIMAAILVNFSLYITKFVVDASNILASEIAMSGFNLEKDSLDGDYGYPTVSETFANSMGLTSFLTTDQGGNKTTVGSGSWGYIIGTMIFLLVATFVFAAGGFLLIIRAGVLLFYLVLSPFMFIGWVFPQLQKYTDQYWSGFLGRAFFAPLYILFIYLSAKILADFTAGRGVAQAGKIMSNASGTVVNDGFFDSFIPFILASIFLIVSIIIANKLGANGGDMVMSSGKNLSKKLGRFTTRKTVGYGALGVSEASRLAGRGYERMDAGMAQSRAGRFARGALSVGTFGALSDRSVRSALGAGQNASIAGSETAEQRRKYNADRQNRQNQTASQMQRERQNVTHQQTLASAGATQEQRADAQNALARNVRAMSNDEINNMSQAEVMAIAPYLTDAQVTARQNSGGSTNQEMTAIRDARRDAVTAQADAVLGGVASTATELNQSFEDLGRNVRGLSNERAADLGIGRLRSERIAMHLSDAQIDYARDSGAITTAEAQEVRAARTRGLTSVATGNLNVVPVGGQSLVNPVNPNTRALVDPANPHLGSLADSRRRALMNGSVQQVGQLPVAVYTQRDMAPFITPEALEQRIRNGGVTDVDLGIIRDNIDDHLTYLMYDPVAQQRAMNQWRTWTNRSPNGARLGLTQI